MRCDVLATIGSTHQLTALLCLLLASAVLCVRYEAPLIGPRRIKLVSQLVAVSRILRIALAIVMGGYGVTLLLAIWVGSLVC